MGTQFRPLRLRSLSSTEVGWIAGLLEGEGSFILSPSRRLPRVQMQTTDHDVLLRLSSVLGAGSVTDVGSRQGRKFVWNFALSAMRDVEALLLQIYPLMGKRRRLQIDLLLGAICERDEAMRTGHKSVA